MAVAAVKPELLAGLIGRYAEPAKGAAWANKIRSEALTRLHGMGAPMRRDEYWKFTDPKALVEGVADAALLDDDMAAIFAAQDAHRIVFVDGAYRADLSDWKAGEGLEIEPLSAALTRDIHWAKSLFGTLEAAGQTPVPRPLAALNTALASEGFVIRVSGTLKRPIAFEYRREVTSAEALIHHLVRIEKGAVATILESGPVAARSNLAIEAEIADGAALHHIRAQGRDHGRVCASHIFARLGAGSQFRSFTLAVNGRMTRNEAVVTFIGDEASAHIAGASAGDGDFHHDDTVFVTHDAVACESRQVFKKVLRNGAKGIFQGKILVKHGAQKTDGYQISQALLLDGDSQFLAKPELEIYADDVVCSHGSTCGAVDETALFYLTSRGISRRVAQDMLVLAFLDEAIAEIANETLATEIRARLGDWLARRQGA